MITKIQFGQNHYNNNLKVHQKNSLRTNSNLSADSVSFTAKKPSKLFNELMDLYQNSIKILEKADIDSSNFQSQGKTFKNVSEHTEIATPTMKNSKGQDFWLEFSSTKQHLSYGEYGPLRNKTVKDEIPSITIATVTKLTTNGTPGKIEYLYVKPKEFEGAKLLDLTTYTSGSCGSGGYSIWESEAKLSGSENILAETIKDSFTKFIEYLSR